jgi:hypothetical protein
MFKHIIMWKIKDQDQEGRPKKEVARRIKSMLESLADKVDVLKRIEVGIDEVKTPSSFDIVLYSEFDSREDYQTYLEHPDHKKAGEYIVSVLNERALVDYQS